MFSITHKSEPDKKLYTGGTRAKCWQKFYEAENTVADNKAEFQAYARMRGFKCCKTQ